MYVRVEGSVYNLLKRLETQSGFYPASPSGKKTEDSWIVDEAEWSFFLSIIPAD